MNKRAIVAESSSRRAKGDPFGPERAGAPHPLVGARFVTSVAQPAQLPPPGPPEIAFAGRSNAGKSSAINALANHARLAFASRTPGRTQQINLFRLRSGALIADLPGYGYAAVGKRVQRDWQELVAYYVATRSPLVALVVVVDARQGLKPLDLDLLAVFVPSGRPVLILATKADKLGVAAQREAKAAVTAALAEAFPLECANVGVTLFSAVTRQGVAEAEATLGAWLPEETLDVPQGTPTAAVRR